MFAFAVFMWSYPSAAGTDFACQNLVCIMAAFLLHYRELFMSCGVVLHVLGGPSIIVRSALE